MTDEKLMELVTNGDLDKMSILFERYQLYLYNFFLRRGHAATTSEDLAQNVFERILKYRQSYKASFSFKTWFFRIARNVESDFIRQKKLNLADVELNRLELTTDNVLDEIEKKEQVSILTQAISMLTEEEQSLLHFSKFQKLKSDEIAAIMDLSASAVRVKIYRAMKALKVNYQKIASL